MDRILVKDRIKVLNDRSKNLASRNYDSILVSKQKLRLLLKLFVSFNHFPFLVKNRPLYRLNRSSEGMLPNPIKSRELVT